MTEFTDISKSKENLKAELLKAGADYVIVNLVELKEFMDKIITSLSRVDKL